MSSSLRRGAFAATAIVLSIASLSACAAGREAEKSLVTRPDDVSARVGEIELHDVTIVTAEDGSGAATVTGRIYNEGDEDQTLEAITVNGSDVPVRLSPAEGGELTVPAGGSLALGGEGKASALIPDAERAGLEDGEFQRIAFELSTTGRVDVRASVFPADHEWGDYGPSTSPSPTEDTPGGSEGDGDTAASPEASGSPASPAAEPGEGAGTGDPGEAQDAEEGDAGRAGSGAGGH